MLARRKMSVTELAERVGITLANLFILKNGKARAIRFSTLEGICRALDCQPGDILEYRPDDTPPSAPSSAPSPAPAGAVPSADYPNGKAGDVLTVEFTVCGIPCLGLNGGPACTHSEAFSFQIATEDQEETDRYWDAIVGNGGAPSACGWCKDRWGLSWQITPRVLTEAMARGGDVAKRAFEAMMEMRKIDVAKIEAA